MIAHVQCLPATLNQHRSLMQPPSIVPSDPAPIYPTDVP